MRIQYMIWKEDADFLPLSNAIAQVKFWKDDLVQAEQFLAYVQTLKKYNLGGWDKMNKEAVEDVEESRIGLKKARLKLVESQNLE